VLRSLRLLACAAAVLALPAVALADADESTNTNISAGLQPYVGAVPVATPAPGESRVFRRADGAYQAIPEVHGRTKVFHFTERIAPWTLRAGLTVPAWTYNGVVPGPTIVVNEGDRVEIDLTNDLTVPDTLHLHGIHGTDVAMDGVAGMSQPMIPANGGQFRYLFTANQSGTFMYHSHGTDEMVDSGLYGGIIVEPAHPRPEELVARDYLQIISAWKIQSDAENHFTLNGKSYPATQALEVAHGEHIRIRWVNISAENDHTMHTHGHDQLVIARDAQLLSYRDVEDTVLLGPGQRVDVVVDANAKPGTWMVHCHILDHIEDANEMPDGLITALHYTGTPNKLTAMYDAMVNATPVMPAMGGMPGMSMGSGPAASMPKRLGFGMTVLLGAIAGFTIFIGLPVARARRLSPAVMSTLNAVAIGILVFLVVEIAHGATAPLEKAIAAWHMGSPFPIRLSLALLGGLLLGLVGLGTMTSQITRRGKRVSDDPLVLALTIAAGIGAHNFAEGLAIGAAAAAGATALSVGLIVGFALHNATEGFGIASPLAGRVVPTWAQLGTAGFIGGAPTFVGTVIGYHFYSAVLSVFFLSIAAGALIYVIGELWSILRKSGGVSVLATGAVSFGFLLAFTTEVVVGLNGG
jgi:ZIP family zinc transporter